ncbi:MAG: hypothetical protein QNJ03_11845 [Dinoroseobacter sp.]|nr:hypothetical protein [Dinoroseobacter sp.]
MKHAPARLALAFCLAAPAALACGFHNYTPQPTLVDRLSVRPELVLARPDSQNPYRFVAQITMGGAPQNADIPFLVDSATRRRLASDPSAFVLFARRGDSAPWERIVFVDNAMSELLDVVLTRLDAWANGDDADRLAYFASLIEDEDRIIRRLALREIDQAEYGALKALALSPNPVLILPTLFQPSEADLLAIRILLLGFSNDDIAAKTISQGLSRVAPSASGSLLGAYATALIEQRGPDGVGLIADNYLSDRSLPPTNRELLVEALAIHAQTGDAELTRAARSAVTRAVEVDPMLAPMAARQFGSRRDWSQVAPLRAALQDEAIRSPSDMITVAEYVYSGRRHSQAAN